jgi:hypothetical protein
MKDLKSYIAPVMLMEPKDTNDNDDETSAWLDTQGFESATVCVLIGTVTGADDDATLLPVLQESDTTKDADATDVDAADMIGAFTLVNSATTDQAVQTVGYKGTKRYIRVKLDYTGTDITASLVAVLGILGHGRAVLPTAPEAVAAT